MIISDLLSDLPACMYVHLCVDTHANPKVKPVLDTNIITRIVN